VARRRGPAAIAKAEHMSRFIVRFSGSSPHKGITARLHDAPTIQVLQETDRMVLVEAEEADLLDVVRPSSSIIIVPERRYEQPDALPRIRREPSK
jgi:hypothetical protein